MQDRGVDLARLDALATSVATLLAAGLDVQARPLAEELAALIKSARGPLASVTSLAEYRGKR